MPILTSKGYLNVQLRNVTIFTFSALDSHTASHTPSFKFCWEH